MIEDHKHCPICGKPMDSDKTLCSPSCEMISKQQQKKMSRTRNIMLLLFIVMFAILILSSTVLKSG